MEDVIFNVKQEEESGIMFADDEAERTIGKIIAKFKNLSYIAIAIVLAGIVFLFTTAYEFKKTGLGICILILFVISGILLQLINCSFTDMMIKQVRGKILRERILGKCIQMIYRISFMVFSIALIACVCIIPFMNQYKYSMKGYYLFIPSLIFLAVILYYVFRLSAHFYLKRNSNYQLAESPFHDVTDFSKKRIYLVVILFAVVIQNSPVICEIMMPILVVSGALVFVFYGILKLIDSI